MSCPEVCFLSPSLSAKWKGLNRFVSRKGKLYKRCGENFAAHKRTFALIIGWFRMCCTVRVATPIALDFMDVLEWKPVLGKHGDVQYCPLLLNMPVVWGHAELFYNAH